MANLFAPMLRIEWKETGGPQVAAPAREGYGSSVIRDLLVYEMAGKVDLVFEISDRGQLHNRVTGKCRNRCLIDIFGAGSLIDKTTWFRQHQVPLASEAWPLTVDHRACCPSLGLINGSGLRGQPSNRLLPLALCA